MDKDTYDKLARTYRFLTRIDNWHRIYYDGYMIYERDIIQERPILVDVLKQFSEIPFGTFYTDKYKQPFIAPHKFFESSTVIFEEKTVKIHYDFSMVIFHYIVYKLKDEIKVFLEVVNSKEYKERFGSYVNEDEYVSKYSLSNHDKIYHYFSQRIPNFELIFHLFNWTGSQLIIVDESWMSIKVSRITRILKSVGEDYNFANFEVL